VRIIWGDGRSFPLNSGDIGITLTPAGASGHTGPTSAQTETAYSAETWYSQFTPSGNTGFQLITINATGDYRIDATGASGGGGGGGNNVSLTRGGYPTKMSGTFALFSGDVLSIVVGQKGVDDAEVGTDNGGGGGGGTYVYSGSTPLLVAGGGGGGAQDSPTDTIGNDASTGTTGNNGGSGGSGGAVSENLSDAAGGGGITGDGGEDVAGEGGHSYNNGSTGGDGSGNSGGDGGFGGGGSGDGSTWGGGGGGGGYSGGDGRDAGGTPPGGGGSYNAGIHQSNNVSPYIQDGSVKIIQIKN
jgi:hypothetical protein